MDDATEMKNRREKNVERLSLQLRQQQDQSKSAAAPLSGSLYICGECHYENEIRPKDPIRCREVRLSHPLQETQPKAYGL
jgi:hypothetical protein